MKKAYKITSFLLALVFCFAAMSCFVLAQDIPSITPYATDACPDHPDAGWSTRWSTTPDGTLIHEYCCTVCGYAFDWDTCNFTGYGDCTAESHCILCFRPNPNTYDAHEYGEWRYTSFTSYHYRVCTRTNCFIEEQGTHNRDGVFGEVGGPYYPQCTVCGEVFYD